MNQEILMETPTGYLRTSRVVLNHFDVSTQVDIQQVALNYGSEDEIVGRGHNKDRRGTAHYDKQDIREQYCISNRGLGALENDKQSLFGCLSSHHSSSCSNRTSLLTACVRQKVPSDENLYELYKRHPSEYAPYPRRSRNPWGPLSPEIYCYDQDLKSSYFRRKIHTDPSRYTWMPSDDESVKMEIPKSVIEHTFENQQTAPSSSLISSKKHVSFARSHTLASIDDAISSISSSSGQLTKTTRSQERLLNVRKTEIMPITRQPESENMKTVIDKIKRAPMKTQATQTEIGLGRKPIPSSHINLSPRSIHKVKMVSQEAQTNGFISNGRKLIKSFSEAGSKFGVSPRNNDCQQYENMIDHEPLQRTQSDEPPRSPFIVRSPPLITLPELAPQQLSQSDSSSLSKSDHDSDSTESKKEIFIDYKPQTSRRLTKKCLIKTLSDGEILLEQRKMINVDDTTVSEKLASISHENISEEEQINFIPYFQNAPIRNEGIYKTLEENIYLSINGGMCMQDSIDEEFHENLIYNKFYFPMPNSQKNGVAIMVQNHEDSTVPSVCLLPDGKLSPFASNDSLTNDARDQSDGIWNESQSTVLQIDSGTDNGTALSNNSELTSLTSLGSTNLLTPSSRRKHLLMLQHQQRSSMDTEALDEETVDQTETYPRIIVEKPLAKESQLSSQSSLLARNTSYMWRKTLQEPTVESPLPAVVPDLLLARTDSCRTNTDISESTTTDDYITATSGTDSSRKSGSVKGMDMYQLQSHVNDGSSFDSAKGVDLLGDDMVVPTFTPLTSTSDDTRASPSTRSLSNTPVPNIRTGQSTPSEESSSSCGSYSVGSTPDLLERTKVPSEISEKMFPFSEDERSIRHSSSGYYDSPIEDESRKSPKHNYNPKKGRKEFSLDLSSHYYLESSKLLLNEKYEPFKKETKISPSSEPDKISVEKSRRSKPRIRSPMQSHKKGLQTKKALYREGSPFQDDKGENKVTSDESSCDIAIKHGINQISPRKTKKNKDNIRRKSLPRSPVSQRISKKVGHNEKPSSLPGSLSRKKSSRQLDKHVFSQNTENKRFSPVGSPSDSKQCLQKSPSSTKLKALSAESLRSVSPGSDSVFYSDPSNHIDHQIHCLHCGKEVDIITTDDPKSLSGSENQHDIVQPPAGFEDSPRTKATARLYKKLDRRIRSEERTQPEYLRYKSDIRAKSEERGASTCKNKLRPMAKSTSNSQEQLKTADSSPSILPGAPEDEDDNGVYDVPYYDGYWIYIDERDEINTCKTSYSSSNEQETERKESISSTESEVDFRKRYQAITHRMVHRKSCLEMYKRQTSKSFAGITSYSGDHEVLRRKVEEIFKIMLVVWCQEYKAVNMITPSKRECDKTVVVHRESGEFGFRIHGSKPVVVSAIEPDTPAETSGLEVGDIVLSVNGVSVLDKSHSEVVKIAHAGSDTLNLEIARTCYAINSPKSDNNPSDSLYSGYLWKLRGYASGTMTNKWIRRWFSLKENNCLYYYKTDSDKQPVGVIMLFNHELQKLEDDDGGLSKPNRFAIQSPGSVSLHLAADTSNAKDRWMEVIDKAIKDSQIIDDFVEATKRNLVLSPNAISQPDCFGYLVKLGTQWKSWSRRYCVLKDACLYFYHDVNARNAFGVAYLHGYKVQQCLSGNKKHAFEIIPPDASKKYYYFHTESDTDRKRWMAALEYSIDRWLKI